MSVKKTGRRFVLLLVSGLAACGVGRPHSSDSPLVPPRVPLAAPVALEGQPSWQVPVTQDAWLALVWSGSLDGRLEPARWRMGGVSEGISFGGGVARRAAYVAWVRAQNPGLPIVHLEAGDSISAEPSRGLALMAALRAMDLDAYNVGARELAGGLGPLKMLVGNSRIPFVSTNLTLAGGGSLKNLVPPYRMLAMTDSAGRPVRVLVLGLGSWGARGPVNRLVADFADPREALERVLDPLRGSADFTVVLAAGFEPRKLACALDGVEGIDFILSGSGAIDRVHSLMKTCGQKMALGLAGGFLINDMRLSRDASAAFSLDAHMVSLDAALPESPEIAAVLRGVPPYSDDRGFPSLLEFEAMKEPATAAGR